MRRIETCSVLFCRESNTDHRDAQSLCAVRLLIPRAWVVFGLSAPSGFVLFLPVEIVPRLQGRQP